MTRRGLKIRTLLVLVLYGIAVGIGCDLRFRYPNREDMHYVLFRDLVPLVVAIPAAWLAYGLQRRLSYLHQLRAVSARAVDAVQVAIRHTRKARPTADEAGAVLADLDAAIEGTRSLFLAVGDRAGRAPDLAEALESIRAEVEALGSDGVWEPSKAEAARPAIEARWNQARESLFQDFDRVVPNSPRRSASGPAPAK
jgi:hypothetical protein